MTGGTRPTVDVGTWGEVSVEPGDRGDVSIVVAESYSGLTIKIPAHVWRASRPGPSVFVTGAVHGDEINGTGAIRHIIQVKPFELVAGALVLVPVVNVQGFERHSRYLPDRRDLNRSFPGSSEGSLAARVARVVSDEIVARCDYGVDLHSAAVRRTNFPNVRADMGVRRVAEVARALGCGLIVDGKGPKGSLRRAATDDGCPTVVLEAGESLKVEPAIMEFSVRAIRNLLISLEMADGSPSVPAYQVVTRNTRWIRAEVGGFLSFHVAPGDVVEKGSPLATNTSLTGAEQNTLRAPRSGVVLGMTTLPAVAPGDAVCHLAVAKRDELRTLASKIRKLPSTSLESRLRSELASSIAVMPTSEEE